MDAGAERGGLERICGVYTNFIQTLKERNVGISPETITAANAKIAGAVHSEIKEALSEVTQVAKQGLGQSNAALAAVQTFATQLRSKSDAVPEDIGTQKLQEVGTSIQLLIASFQSTAEDPTSLFPRFPCGDIPVDPSILTRSSTWYPKGGTLLQKGSEHVEREPSPQTTPKTGREAVLHLNKSLGSFGEGTGDSLQSLSLFMEDFRKLQTVSQGLQKVCTAISEMSQKQDLLCSTMRSMASHFSPKQLRSVDGLTDDTMHTDIFALLKGALENLQRARKLSVDIVSQSVPKLQEASKTLATLDDSLGDLISHASSTFQSLAVHLQQVRESLPRIGGELRQLFLPTGVKAFFLRPSDTLLSILENARSLEASLSEALSMAQRATKKLDDFDPRKGMEAMSVQLQSIQSLPSKLVEVFENEDIHEKICGSLERVISQVCSDMGAAGLEEAATTALNNFELGAFAGKLASQIGISGEKDGEGQSKSHCNEFAPAKGSWLDSLVSSPWKASDLFS